ncbi:hypothetical protein ES332_A02G103000v1 [Gossypium tomentosum]|uniref:Protein kinase domain-containing protein n=1 Tax=Gossypium tomentosum TaxID=34277 RepID=A0A5D2RF86_GOSTO|nr:hypothetical protein ES332_A02G103000v1 [Gossypium tomentosum]
MNHRSLKHPNLTRFKEVLLTPTHLAIVMEYAAGGELFERICNAGRFSEDEVEKVEILFSKRIFLVMEVHTLAFCSSVLDSLTVELKASKDFSKLFVGIAILWLHLSLN